MLYNIIVIESVHTRISPGKSCDEITKKDRKEKETQYGIQLNQMVARTLWESMMMGWWDDDMMHESKSMKPNKWM